MTREELIIILGINIAFFVGYWIGRKQEKEKREIKEK
jgi:uncharacterized protein YneF (UPF0154 family)